MHGGAPTCSRIVKLQHVKKSVFCPPKGSTVRSLIAQIRSRDQSARRNSGIESTVNNSSTALLSYPVPLSLSLFLLLFSFFFGATWLARRRCIDSSASIRSTIYARDHSACFARFSIPSFFPPFFLARHRKRQREHKPPTRATEFTPANGRAKCVRLARPSLICHGEFAQVKCTEENR